MLECPNVWSDNRSCTGGAAPVTQPREVALYGRAFNTLAGQSVTGDAARSLILKARTVHGGAIG